MTVRELDYVQLKADVGGVPAGTRATVVAAHTDPEGYTLELSDSTLVDVSPDQIEVITPAPDA